jgi:hypothetical protein
MKGNPKAEIRDPKEARRPKSEKAGGSVGVLACEFWQRLAAIPAWVAMHRFIGKSSFRVRPSEFGLLSAFGVRPSGFIRPSRFMRS